MKENMFAKAAKTREQEQNEIKVQLAADDETSVERTTMTLSMSVEDKKNLKLLAMEKGITVSKMLHYWIQEELKNK